MASVITSSSDETMGLRVSPLHESVVMKITEKIHALPEHDTGETRRIMLDIRSLQGIQQGEGEDEFDSIIIMRVIEYFEDRAAVLAWVFLTSKAMLADCLEPELGQAIYSGIEEGAAEHREHVHIQNVPHPGSQAAAAAGLIDGLADMLLKETKEDES